MPNDAGHADGKTFLTGMTQRDRHIIKLAWTVIRGTLRNEAEVQAAIARLLSRLGIDLRIQMPVPGGSSADIVAPAHRIVIEVKDRGLGDDPNVVRSSETPKQQVERYAQALAEHERARAGVQGAVRRERQWIGIVTDGDTWHAWEYDADVSRLGRRITEVLDIPGPEELLDWLDHVFGEDPLARPIIPADPYSLFVGFRDELLEIYRSLSGHDYEHTTTKQELWLDILEASGMRPDNPFAELNLFVVHSFLVALARGVIVALNHAESQEPDVRKVLDTGFVAWIVSDAGAGSMGRDWAARLLTKIRGYDWRRQRGDVLRPLYEKFVDAKDRSEFGEFYTPDWMAEAVVADVLDDAWCEAAVAEALNAQGELRGRGVLDPACGSGTFLYHAAKRLLRSDAVTSRQLSDRQVSDAISRLVNGIDVHPVAVEMARASVLRALPAAPDGGTSAIRIYLGDSLIASGDRKGTLFSAGPTEYTFKSPQRDYLTLPAHFIDQPTFGRLLSRMVQAAVAQHPLPKEVQTKIRHQDAEAFSLAWEALQRIVAQEGDSVWTWFIANVTGPARLQKQKVDRIVANPPWVKMSTVQPGTQRKGNRKDVLEQLFRDLDIWAGGKRAPHNDIAALFVLQCRRLYLQHPASDPAAWLVQSAALDTGNWAPFRAKHKTVRSQTIDFQAVNPFGDGRTCCALYDCRPSMQWSRGDYANAPRLKAELAGTSAPKTNMSLERARERIRIVPATLAMPPKASDYCDATGKPLVRNGATLFPYVLTRVHELRAVDDKVQVTTKRSTKGRWASVPRQTALLPAHWIRPVAVPRQVLPFCLLTPLPQAIVPVKDGKLHPDPVQASKAWANLNDIWQRHQGKGRSTPQTLLRQLDFYSKLSQQLVLTGRQRTLMLHPALGSVMRACRIVPGTAVCDHNLYYYNAASEDEAAFLVGIFNATSLKNAFVAAKASGRSFDTRPWREIPVPRFTPSKAAHVQIVAVTTLAERTVAKWLTDGHGKGGQIAQTRRIHELLENRGIMTKLNAAVRSLLPEYAKSAA